MPLQPVEQPSMLRDFTGAWFVTNKRPIEFIHPDWGKIRKEQCYFEDATASHARSDKLATCISKRWKTGVCWLLQQVT